MCTFTCAAVLTVLGALSPLSNFIFRLLRGTLGFSKDPRGLLGTCSSGISGLSLVSPSPSIPPSSWEACRSGPGAGLGAASGLLRATGWAGGGAEGCSQRFFRALRLAERREGATPSGAYEKRENSLKRLKKCGTLSFLLATDEANSCSEGGGGVLTAAADCYNWPEGQTAGLSTSRDFVFFFFFFLHSCIPFHTTASSSQGEEGKTQGGGWGGGGCCTIHANKTSNRSATGDHVTSVHFLKCSRAKLKAEARINLSRTCLLISSGKTNTAALKTTKVHAELSSNNRGVRESEEA